MANLNTSLPVMFMVVLMVAHRVVAGGHRGCRRPACRRWPAPLPSLPRSKLKMLPLSVGCTSTAPAPSPKSTQVLRSSQSSMRLSTSAPITSTLR